jgi:hypothetical protein
MWFLNDITIASIGFSEGEILAICQKEEINVGFGCYKSNILGRIIADKEYQRLIEALINEKNKFKNKTL